MATTFKRLAWADLGLVLTTELNSLANGAYSAWGTAYDNSSGLYLYGALEINLNTLNPTAGAYLQHFMSPALGGTNYDDVPSATNLSPHRVLGPPVSITSGVNTTKRAMLDGGPWNLPGFPLPASLLKFAQLNGCGPALNAGTNTVRLFGAYDQGV